MSLRCQLLSIVAPQSRLMEETDGLGEVRKVEKNKVSTAFKSKYHACDRMNHNM